MVSYTLEPSWRTLLLVTSDRCAVPQFKIGVQKIAHHQVYLSPPNKPSSNNASLRGPHLHNSFRELPLFVHDQLHYLAS